jgi:hypothetical protein
VTNRRLLILLLGCLSVPGWSSSADDNRAKTPDPAPQTWVSPNLQLNLHHRLSADLRSTEDVTQEQLTLTSYTLSTAKGAVLWTGTSWVDESAHSFDCVWAHNSGSALILERPERSSIRAFLIRVSAPASSAVQTLQTLIDEVLTKAGDTDDRNLQKAWFGEWRYREGKFEGIAIVACGKYHRLRLSLDPSADSPSVAMVEATAHEAWDEALAKLP